MSGTPGRRVAQRPQRTTRNPLSMVAVAAPVVACLAVLVQASGGSQPVPPRTPPEREPLAAHAVACPAPAGAAGPLWLASTNAPDAASGALAVRAAEAGTPAPLALPAGGYVAVPDAGAVVIEATGSLAPGLFGARFGTPAEPSAGECVAPAGERWFVGVGAGGVHEGSLHLVNPDDGPAVADVTLWSIDGRLEQVESRGLTVAPHTTTRLDLAQLAPHRDQLTMRVTAVRGRVAASVTDRYTPTGGRTTNDWLPATSAPATSTVVPGLPRASTEHTLVLTNPGEDEGRVTLEVVGARSTFAPAGFAEIRVPAGSVVATDITKVLGESLPAEDGSLLLTSTVPVAASVRSVASGDLVHTVGLPTVKGRAAATVALPGERRLVITPWESSGPVEVTFLGAVPATVTAALKAGTTTTVEVPADAVGVVVRSSARYAAALRVTRPSGVAWVPLRPLVEDHLIPHVSPAQLR